MDEAAREHEAKAHARAFALSIATLLRAGGGRFDLVIAPYNSGAVLVDVAHRVAHRVGRAFWPTLLLPVYTPYRFANATNKAGARPPYDNAALIPGIRRTKFPGLARSLLFIDDEIGNGRAFAECMTVFMGAVGDDAPVPLSCMIVAEEDGAHTAYAFPRLTVQLRPFATRPSPWASGAFFELVSDELAEAFRPVGDGRLDKKQIASILLGLPTKTLVNGVPRITDALNREATRLVAGFDTLRAEFAGQEDALVADGARAAAS